MGFASISAEIHHADFSDSHFTNQNIRIVSAAIAPPKDLPDITYGALDDDGGTVAQAGAGQDFQISGSAVDELRGGGDCLGSLRQCIEARAAANDNPHFQEQAA